MSKSITTFVALGFVALVSACGGGQQEEIVFVEPDPVIAEPIFNGKIK